MIARPDQANERQLRGFAILLPVAALFVAWMVQRHAGVPVVEWPRWTVWLAGAVGAWSVLGMVKPPIIRPLYLLLGWATWPIGVVISTVLVALLFYGVVTPIGWVLRLRGRDPLLLRTDPRVRAGSLWFERPGSAPRSRYSRMS